MEEYEVTVDNRPETPEVPLDESVGSSVEPVEAVIDCDVFFPNGTCKENFDDFDSVNAEDKIYDYFDRFASCQSVDCIVKERTYLEERSQLGDPNAMYAMSLFLRFGLYNYTHDETLSETYLQFASDGGSALASIALGTIPALS